MDLMPTADQDAIRDSVRTFLAKELPGARVRAVIEGTDGDIAGLWTAAAELGFFGLGLPESAGGAGYALSEEMVLFEELGRSLAPGPWLGTVLTAHALAYLPIPPKDVLPRLLRGDLRVAVVDVADELRWDGDRLLGRRQIVPNAAFADAFLILDQGRAVLAYANQAGVSVHSRPSLDATNPIGAVEFDNVATTVLVDDAKLVAQLQLIAMGLSCADAVGGIERTLEMSVEYAKVRQQFGRPIGSFQAIKHRCADMAVRAEVSRAATAYAVCCVRDQTADADFQVSVAKVLCANAYLQNAADNIQNHGGMGFTWECDAHLFLKRARTFDVTYGSRSGQIDALVQRMRASAA